MKKFLALLLAVLMCLTITACGTPKTLEDACKKADSLVAKWDKETKYTCGFIGNYDSEYNVYCVESYSLTAADETELAKEVNAKQCTKFVYNELIEIFMDFDVKVLAVMLDENQRIYYAYDGEPIDLEGIR